MRHAITASADRTITRRTGNTRPPRFLDLAYHPEVPQQSLLRLERAARIHGLSLNELELLGQEQEYADGFAQAVFEGDAEHFLQLTPWDHLERRLHTQPA